MNIQQILQKKLGVASVTLKPVAGGSINETYHVSTPHESFFCKINSATKFPHLFKSEKAGLELIRKQKCIQVPDVLDVFEENDRQILMLEWIDAGERSKSFWKNFGESLAALHKNSSNYFGLDKPNYMGSVLQSNTKHNNWVQFFAQERLHPLIKRCSDQQLLTKQHVKHFDALIQKLSMLFEEESPALLHGDLWSGNFMCNEKSLPVLIDPAVYYGHRSIDLGMTTLFGGFQPSFYEAYHHHFPLPLNYKEQWKVCNLYPLLIHLTLFGKSYLSGIESTLNDFQ